MTGYNIWKIVGCGNRTSRYYESREMFERWLEKFRTDWYWRNIKSWKAYRFSSEGWIELDRNGVQLSYSAQG